MTGPGGAGKTRLALEVSRRLRDHFTEGVRLVELASVATVDLLASAVAARLGVPEQAGRSALHGIQDLLKDRPVLLILDSCEGSSTPARTLPTR